MKSSDRQFGFVFAIVFAAIALFPLLHRHPVRLWAMAISAALLLLSFLEPAVLHAPNLVWQRLASAMNAVMTPVAMAVLYFGVVTPTALILRLAGKDALRLRANPHAASYWIPRNPPGPPGQSMTNPF